MASAVRSLPLGKWFRKSAKFRRVFSFCGGRNKGFVGGDAKGGAYLFNPVLKGGQDARVPIWRRECQRRTGKMQFN
jgi:hypothetical protein